MTEQLVYRIYKLTNSSDDMVYIGSTRQPLSSRMTGHRDNARDSNCKKKIALHMRTIGVEKFKIELIKEVTVGSRKDARVEEQLEIEKHDKAKLLNSVRAYSANHDKTRDITKKRKVRRDYYHRKITSDAWHDKEKERNRVRMALKREKEKQLKNRILPDWFD